MNKRNEDLKTTLLTSSRADDNVIMTAKTIASEVIEKAYSDIVLIGKESSKANQKLQADAYLYFQSDEYARHCEILGLSPSYIIRKSLSKSQAYIETGLRLKKSRLLVGATSKDFKRTSGQILKDTESLRNIIS